ncbi:multifunctional CCA addition/repair protein [Shewanella sp. NIFS-20-20]|uniref:multifunctional CCA addition/repair protein n=1 Tax=Shewanella sp. NIFS-20-20 TaxID=2853806 RepID=UPI001C474B5C|nr:multifunctional CCA addition/repair protein [Shewanella sp. NIFS-20-20]
MDIYLVGGAVRDRLLGLAVKDRDYLVVGATPAQMLALDYRQVGKDFPVFLHPTTQDEYALARIERKVGVGYSGFECDASAHVTLEQDLLRRDLTINAIAEDCHGQLHDPYHGLDDIQSKTLRHVSAAFTEDPLRVLRVARFAARFAPQGFSIASSTLALMSEIAASGELNSLSAERVAVEIEKALQTQAPQIFFEVLHRCGALKVLIPELDALFGVPQPPQHHPEIDTGLHSLLVLEQAALLTQDPALRFAALVHDLGKALTPAQQWPKHHGHDKLGLTPVKQLCERLRLPNQYKELALMATEYHQLLHTVMQLRPETLLKIFDKNDMWRKPERLEALIVIGMADSQGRHGFESAPYPQGQYLRDCYQAASAIEVQKILAQGYKGAEIKTKLTELRQASIAKLKNPRP